ncbi:conserved hypothetical protein [Uncinocarpus reesii 1704]|uniref:Wbp11/ELF5/Saf1 N-terminal domain-containing protein n=1 Tax=Uncinocarpus reesii (strain UAMH 1704) TaxID=336963 RepID=C4JU35_UNCRE|nr:uncharacterized protein UREG_05974 [Uncinocarpus reesii 1704]EEP81132.1 conserved hypothetical protein [Uncinocarpus reesii 1704]
MAKDKERSVNPAQAQRRLEKQRALKKGKAELQNRRNEKLARRNPERLQRQIDELKSAEESGQQLRPREKQILEGLEKDLKAIRKARESLGDRAPQFGGGDARRGQGRDRDAGRGVLGKRRRDGWDRRRERDDASDTDESVRNIPMPRDTPPPIPRQHQRRGPTSDTEPGEQRQIHGLPEKPPIETKTIYEAAPAIRNLQQEAVNKFVPAAVRMKQAAVKGQGRLVEPEEMERLEKEGYVAAALPPSTPRPTVPTDDSAQKPGSMDIDAATLAEEEERFRRELKHVQIEEVEDEEI